MITERAMLAAIHISIWTAVKHDRKISRDVASQHGAHESAGRYNKQLLRGAEKLEALRSLAGQIRQVSTRSRCRGPMKGIVCCQRTFTFSSLHRSGSSKPRSPAA